MKIHKFIINNNNINYNFLQYEYKNNENFNSEIKKKILDKLKNNKIKCYLKLIKKF